VKSYIKSDELVDVFLSFLKGLCSSGLILINSFN